MAPILSVVIPTWNGLRHLPECFAALLPQLPLQSEVILVDNGSADGTATWVGQSYPEVRHLRLPNNIGFAGGVNAGLRAARADLIFLLNDDAFLAPECINQLLATAAAYPQAGTIAAVLTFAHRPEIVASAGIRARQDGLALDLWAGRMVADLPSAPVPIMGGSGGAMLLRRAMLNDIGLLAAEFFNYLEDVDLAWRAQLRGWQALLAPHALVRHVYSATAGQGSPFKQRLLGRNRIAAILRCFPTPILLRSLPLICVYDSMAVCYGLATRQTAIVTGRIEAFQRFTMTIAQRKTIQARRTATIEAFANWLEPVGMPWEILAEQQQLAALLATRSIEL